MTNERDRIGEIQDRLRRIETRLTAWMEWSGFDTRVTKAEWNEDLKEINIPSLDIRVKDVLTTIPPGRASSVDVMHKGVFVLRVLRPES